jgi:hypothetical protein
MHSLNVLTQGPPPMKQNMPKEHACECLWGEKVEIYLGLSERAPGGRAECSEVTREANCSIQLTQKMQSIFITDVTSMWIPKVTDLRANCTKISHFLLLRHG